MGKTLIINGADFSAIKVGNVEVPRVYQQKTLDWIAASGNTFTDAQKEALDDLVLALDANNGALWSKIDRLWMPLIAFDKAHSLYDYKNATDSYNNMDSTSKGIFDNNVNFTNKGLLAPIQISNAQLTVDSTFEIDTQNVSFFIMNSETYPTIASSTIRASLGTNSIINTGFGTFVLFIQQLTESNGGRMNVGFPTSDSSSLIRVSSAGTSDMYKPHLFGVISDSEKAEVMEINGTFHQVGSEVVSSATITGINLLTGSTRNMIADTVSKCIFIVGKAMSHELATTLQNRIEALHAAMSA